jgi:hypothetical protein
MADHPGWSASGLWIEMRAIFLMRSRICPTLLSQRERLMCTTCHERVHVMCIRFLLHNVHRFKLSRLSDMSNHLSYGHQHEVNLSE